jgi:hypothetical protein
MRCKRCATIAAVIVLSLTLVGVYGCSYPHTPSPRTLSPQMPDDIVIRVTSEGVQITDTEGGDDLQEITVDPANPIGSLSAQLKDTAGRVTLLSGGTILFVSFQTNPACTCSCVGSTCKCRPRGCVR